MSTHIGQINSLINQIKKAGGLDLDKLHMVILLRSMPTTDNWNVVVTSLKSRDEKDLTKEVIIKALTEQADDLSRGKASVASKVYARNAAFNTGDNPHRGKFVKNEKHENLVCYKCGLTGHFKNECKTKEEHYKTGNSNGGRFAKSNRNGTGGSKFRKDTDNFAFVSTVLKTVKQSEWLKDSGASPHYTWDRKVFSTFEETNDSLQVGNGMQVAIKGVGDVKFLATTSKGSTHTVKISNVYYAPDMCVNLISTAALDDKGISEISSNGITTFNLDGNEVMCARRNGNKWIMNFDVLDVSQHAVHLAQLESKNQLWHKRFCHLGYQNLEKVSKLVDGFEFANGEQPHVCKDCGVGKLSRRSFKPSQGPRAKHPLDIVHLDVNVINVAGREGEKYLLLLTDDHSGCRFGFPMKTKSGVEILEQVMAWLPWAERITDRKLKAIRHDNAKEFVAGVFGQAMRRMGVEVQLSVAYEHEQNGTAENSNRVIMDKSRTILLESGLDKSYWPDAVLTSVYATNRSPHRGRDGIPMEKFSSNRVNVSNLRVFGSWCWARVPTEKLQGRNKLEPRAMLGRFLGYANGGHAYRIMLFGSGEVIASTNVKFDELAKQNPELISVHQQQPEKQSTEWDFSSDGEPDDEPLFEKQKDQSSDVMPEFEEDQHDDEMPELEEDLDDMEEDTVPNQEAQNEPRRSSRAQMPIREWWRVDSRNPVHFALRTESAETTEDPAKRKAARDKEIDTIERYGTWELVQKPKDHKAVSCKWVDTIKKDGTYKSRLVVRGFTQIQGVDFFDTFAPVAKSATVRIFLVICNEHGMIVHQSDVTAAYLNSSMEEVLYMEQPEGYVKFGKDNIKLYCRLLKAIYGTKQAGRAWRKTIKLKLEFKGFKTSVFDPCLFVRGSGDTLILILVWVDDILIGYYESNRNEFLDLWKYLSEEFTISDLGEISDYVGMQIKRDRPARVLILSQSDNIDKMCKHFEVDNLGSQKLPIKPSEVLLKIADDEEIYNKPFRSLIGCLLYPAQWTRPDISYVVGQLSQFLEKPTKKHWEIGIGVLKYLMGTRNLSMVYRGSNNMEVTGYSDSNFAADLETGKSVYGYVIYVGGSPVSWKSKKSKTTATSATMAELEALYHAVTEGIWIHQMLKSLGLVKEKYIKIFCDNMAVVSLVHGEKYLDRTKHEVVRVEFLRDKIRDGTLKVEWIGSEKMRADIFTKGLGNNLFGEHVGGLNLEEEETTE